jgi:hypothetical protein
MKISNRFAAPILLAGLLCTTAALHAEVVLYDDTAGSAVGGEGIGGSFKELYNSFSSDATGGALTDLKLQLECTDDCTGTLDVSLYSDSSTSPGSLIAQLATVNDSDLATYSLVDIPLTSNPTLAPNTRYWIVFSGSTNDLWFFTDDISGVGVANEYQGDNVEGPLSNKSSGPYLMEVAEGAVATPEPAAWLLSLSAAGVFGLVRRRRA